MKTTFTAILVGCMCAGIQTATADIIGNFDGLDFDTPSLPGNGQFDAPGTISADVSALYGGTTGSIVFNLSGLDITGDSTANDSASFTINVSAVGGNLADTGNTGLQIGITGNGASGLSDPSELLTFSFDSGSVTLGDPGIGGAVNFIGFRNIALNGFGDGEILTLSGGTDIDGSFTGSDQSPFNSTDVFGNVSSFTVNAGNGTDNFGIERLGARIQFLGTSAAVPEPSSLAMLSAIGVGFIIRRRRQADRRNTSRAS